MRIKRSAFGEAVEGYAVPVFNEREIRASAGILFLILFTSWMQILFRHDFTPIKYGLIVFLSDFIIRVFVNPEYSPTLVLGRYIVRRQTPEFVGAAQKSFAWKIGLVLSTIMFLHMVVANSYSFITGIICLTCLSFLFFESAFGICLGCLFYGMFHQDRARYCPGDTCGTRIKKDIRKVSWAQTGVVVGFIIFMMLTAYLFNEYFGLKPRALWEILQSPS
ncbi:MAG: DUF4395 domain-containing protein [Spirochaetae bacterium HGW-Spirochaetae-7]|jgi:hypothetical protein|nr:MAG: DUF4395 domain-containing protein [Spirochaetae bacterium HGW-Spirochaetae-7]